MHSWHASGCNFEVMLSLTCSGLRKNDDESRNLSETSYATDGWRETALPEMLCRSEWRSVACMHALLYRSQLQMDESNVPSGRASSSSANPMVPISSVSRTANAQQPKPCRNCQFHNHMPKPAGELSRAHHVTDWLSGLSLLCKQLHCIIAGCRGCCSVLLMPQ